MSNKMSTNEFDEWLDEHRELLQSIDYNIYDDDLNAKDKKILQDFQDKELAIEYGDLTKGDTLYNVFYTYGGAYDYEGTTNDIKLWLAMHNHDRLYEGNMLEWEDEFSFEEIDVSIYKESKHE